MRKREETFFWPEWESSRTEKRAFLGEGEKEDRWSPGEKLKTTVSLSDRKKGFLPM